MNLYNKYRPIELSEVIGNSETIESIQKMLNSKKEKPHSFLFTGNTGCGKTTISKIMARELGAVDSDFKEIDSADFRGIDSVRDIKQKSQFKAISGDNIVWLIDECHKLTNDAQNALLKLLETPPKHVYFILATTDPQKLLPTIKGRCIHYTVEPLGEKQVFKLLRRVVKGEGETLAKNIYEQIALDSLGHPRNAINILEQVLSVSEENRLKIAKKSAEEESEAFELCSVLLKKGGWKQISTILNSIKTVEPESVRRMVLGYCSSVLLKSDNERAGIIMEEFIEPFYNTGFSGLVFACYTVYKS